MNNLPTTMVAAVLTGHGGLEKLEYRTNLPVPSPEPDEVLIFVAAAGINNTDVNTRLGWYSKSIGKATNDGGENGFEGVANNDAAWSGTALTFPRIQGADVVGTIVTVGPGVDTSRLGERVIVRTMLRHYVGGRPFECWTLGSECDGGFAQFVVAPASETFAVRSALNDEALAAIPCSYSTAENMLHRAEVGQHRVLVTGASGGVGMAAVQLARRRGAEVVAVSSAGKANVVRAAGASEIIDRMADPRTVLGERSIDVVLDIVGGSSVASLLSTLRVGGRYAVAGAIGGPIVDVDLRTIYLRDLSLLGCTFQDDQVFTDLVSYIERDEIAPVVSKSYALKDIRTAQQDFMDKKYPGKLVLVPPAVELTV